MVAIFSSAGLAAPSASARPANSGLRTSSGHSIVCITMTSSRTRSTATVIRVRIETVTTAIRSAALSASRSSA